MILKWKSPLRFSFLELSCLNEITNDLSLQIDEVKQKIDNDLKLGAPSTQKLIFQGKILKDTQTVAEAGIKAGSLLVCMISKVVVTSLLISKTFLKRKNYQRESNRCIPRG